MSEAAENISNEEEINTAEELAAIRAGYEGTQEPAESQPKADEAAGTDPALPAKAEPATEDRPAEETAALREQDTVIADLQKQIREINGRYGAVNDEVDKLRKALATAKAAVSDSGAAPTQKQIAAALSNQAEMDKLTQDYPEFTPFSTALKEVLAVANKSPAIPQTPTIDTEAIKREAREMAKLDGKHEDWEEVIQTDQFLDFALTGGPSRDEYAKLQQLRNPNGTLQRGYLEGLNQMVKAHPDWWADKGAAFFSDKAKDALRLLDDFKASQKPVTKPDKTKQREDRLRANLTPQGSGQAGAQSDTEFDAIRKGYKQEAAKHLL